MIEISLINRHNQINLTTIMWLMITSTKFIFHNLIIPNFQEYSSQVAHSSGLNVSTPPRNPSQVNFNHRKSPDKLT